MTSDQDQDQMDIAAAPTGRGDDFSVTLDGVGIDDERERARADLPDDAWVCCASPDLKIVDVPWDYESMGFALADKIGADAACPGFFLRNTKTPGSTGLRLPFARMHDGELQAVREGLEMAKAHLGMLDIPTLPESQREPARAAETMIAEYLARYAAGAEQDAMRSGLTIEDACRAIETLSRPTARAVDAAHKFGIAIPMTAALLAATIDSRAVYRWSRMDVHLDDRQRSAITRAIEIAERTAGRGDAVTVKAVADELRADGFDEYLSPEGLCVEVWAARTGVQQYSNGQETWGEYRSLDEVGSDASLASWSLKPFTDDHPPELVTMENYRKYAVGTTGEIAVMVQGPDGQHYVKVKIFVGDIETLRKIEGGKVELSAGYTVVPLDRRGVCPISGVPYRYCQTCIRINHLALVDAGRAGPLARINIDGAWELLAHKDRHMNTDQLSPEQGAMLISSIVSYLSPESPEVQAASLETIANMSGMEGSTIAESFAPFVQMSAPEEMGMDMVEVDLADGLKVKMTKDQRMQWIALRTTHGDAATERDQLQAKLASRDAEIATLDRQVARLNDDLDKRQRAQLIDSVADICPDLVGGWRKIGADEKIVAACKPLVIGKAADGADMIEPPLTAIQRAIVCDLDPAATDDFAAAVGRHGKNWAAHVQSSFDTTIRLCRGRGKTNDDGARAPTGDGLTYNQRLSLVRTGQVASH